MMFPFNKYVKSNITKENNFKSKNGYYTACQSLLIALDLYSSAFSITLGKDMQSSAISINS